MCSIMTSASAVGWPWLVPAQAALLPPSSLVQGKENTRKSSWGEVSRGRGHSAVAMTGKIDSI